MSTGSEAEFLKRVEGVPFHTPCARCGRPIVVLTTAVMVNRWDDRLRRTVADGPYHGACAKREPQ